MLSQIARGDRPSTLFRSSLKSDPKSHAAVVAVIPIDYQNPPPVVAAAVVAVIPIDYQTSTSLMDTMDHTMRRLRRHDDKLVTSPLPL